MLAPCFKAFASVVFVSMFCIATARIDIRQITVRDSKMTPLASDISIRTEFIQSEKSKFTLNQARLAFRKESGSHSSASLTVTHMRSARLVKR